MRYFTDGNNYIVVHSGLHEQFIITHYQGEVYVDTSSRIPSFFKEVNQVPEWVDRCLNNYLNTGKSNQRV